MPTINRSTFSSQDGGATWDLPVVTPIAYGIVADFTAGTPTALLTIPAVFTRCIVLGVIARAPTGTLPTSWSVGFGSAGNVMTSRNTAGLTTTAPYIANNTGLTNHGSAGATLSVYPSGAAAGTITYDVWGYFA